MSVDSNAVEELLNKYEMEEHSRPRKDAVVEIRQRFRRLVSETKADNFWSNQYRDLAKEVMQVAGLPDDFKEHGTTEAFGRLKTLKQIVDMTTQFYEGCITTDELGVKVANLMMEAGLIKLGQ